jgi:glyoxylase-like metal-dependent hydrolase (beta-lactamase superfamily II)
MLPQMSERAKAASVDGCLMMPGQSLFSGGIDKTWSKEDFASLVEDVSTKLFDRLPDETWFYPGHGNDSPLGAERPHLQEWRDRGW